MASLFPVDDEGEEEEEEKEEREEAGNGVDGGCSRCCASSCAGSAGCACCAGEETEEYAFGLLLLPPACSLERCVPRIDGGVDAVFDLRRTEMLRSLRSMSSPPPAVFSLLILPVRVWCLVFGV